MNNNMIVRCEGWAQDEYNVYLVMEFVLGGEFFNYLRGVGKIKADHAA